MQDYERVKKGRKQKGVTKIDAFCAFCLTRPQFGHLIFPFLSLPFYLPINRVECIISKQYHWNGAFPTMISCIVFSCSRDRCHFPLQSELSTIIVLTLPYLFLPYLKIR